MRLTGDIDGDDTIYSTGPEVDKTEMQGRTGADLDTASSKATPKFNIKEDNPEQGTLGSHHLSGRISRTKHSKRGPRRSEYKDDPKGLTFKPRDKLLGSTANYLHPLDQDPFYRYSVEPPVTGQQETYGTTSVPVDSLSYPRTSPKLIVEPDTASTTWETPTEESYETALRSSAHDRWPIQMADLNEGYNKGIKVSIFMIRCRGNMVVAHVDSIYPQDIVPSDDVPIDQIHDALVSQLNPYLAGDDCG